jgi:AraC-like DNA-binding protein
VLSSHAGRGTASTISGPRSACIELDTSQPFSACGVHFKPGGAFPFIAVPANELHNQAVTLDALWGPLAQNVEAQVWEAPTPDQRLRILENALLAQLPHCRERHPAVAYAVTAIDRSRGTQPIADIAERIGISTRRFLDLFCDQVGLSPKAFSRMRRFAAVLALLDRTTDIDWTDVALSSGYFDQAHFNHDFRAFSGVTPSEYLRSRASRTHLVVPD